MGSLLCISRVCGIFMQILLLVPLILYLLTIFSDIKFEESTILIFFIVAYVLYIIIEFNSPTFSFLRNKINQDEIKSILFTLIKTNPTIELEYNMYQPNVNNKKYEINKIGTTNVNFPYYCSRDVSGLLELDILKDSLKDKAFVALNIEYEINFADELSFMDYENFRNDFYDICFKKTNNISYSEKRFIVPKFKNFTLIRIGDKDPCSVNIFLFILFTIIPVAEFYICYIYSFFTTKTFVIRKLISTRYDLNQEQYQIFNPYVKFLDQIYDFDINDYNYINKEYQSQTTWDNEIDYVSEYKHYVPKYECESYININEKIKIGIIKDEPKYRNDEINGIITLIPYGRKNKGINNDLNNNNNVYNVNEMDDKNNLNCNNNLNTNLIEIK